MMTNMTDIEYSKYLLAASLTRLETLADLQEVRIEISRVNEAAGQTVFNPAATEALDSVIRDLS